MKILQSISLKNKKILENQIEELIKKDPSVLGFGKLCVKDAQRITEFGKLDLILADNSDEDREIRYIIEIQLGQMDASHILRAIEYWDDQRRKNPEITHYPVIIAEKVTGRYFNVINLFKSHKIPISLIEINAFEVGGEICINFNTIFGPQTENDDKDLEITDQSYWMEKSNEENLALMNNIFGKIKSEISDKIELKYNKHYIGITLCSKPFNFICFRPKKSFLRLQFCRIFTDEMKQFCNNYDIEILSYQEIRLTKKHIENSEICSQIVKFCIENYNF